MAASYLGRCAIAVEEALVLAPYPDGRFFSQGLGHQDPLLTATSPPISIEQAWALFAEDLPSREKVVHNLVTVPMAQYEEDALIKFYFNAGDDLRAVAALLNAGNKPEAMAKLLTFNRKQPREGETIGEFSPGLASRREREMRMFLYGDYSLADKPAPRMKLWRNLPLTKETVEYIEFPPDPGAAAP